MNLKDRGLTVGDLLLILVFVVSTVFIINKIKYTEKKSYFLTPPNEIITSEIS